METITFEQYEKVQLNAVNLESLVVPYVNQCEIAEQNQLNWWYMCVRLLLMMPAAFQKYVSHDFIS